MKNPQTFTANLLLLFLPLFLSGCEFEYSVDNQRVIVEDVQRNQPTFEPTQNPDVARVMTYNIQNFSSEASLQGNRVEKLKRIIGDIEPTVVALQEVEDRTALELIFPPDQWYIVIDDDSPDRHDLAFAVRRPWRINSVKKDLDADDDNFLAEDRRYESYFPNRRDGLYIHIETPDGQPAFTAVNIHAKSRRDSRSRTEQRRVGASRVLVEKIRTELNGRNVVLMGDFNDTPDDASLNILETGNPKATPGAGTSPGDFMINLTEALWDKNQVTLGARHNRLDRDTGLLRIDYPDARQRNNDTRNRDVSSGPVMFDQILVSKPMKNMIVPGSTQIYRDPVALEGPGFSRPSDHLPVYVDIRVAN